MIRVMRTENSEIVHLLTRILSTVQKNSEQEGNQIRVSYLESSLFPLIVAATDKGLAMLDFYDKNTVAGKLSRLRKQYGARLCIEHCAIFDKLQDQLESYFAGTRKEFSIPLDIRGTAFQMEAWEALQKIPWGQTCSYREQAHAMGNTKALRAVGRANGSNPVIILIPCHRVIGADGSLRGYGGGVSRKKILLDLES